MSLDEYEREYRGHVQAAEEKLAQASGATGVDAQRTALSAAERAADAGRDVIQLMELEGRSLSGVARSKLQTQLRSCRDELSALKSRIKELKSAGRSPPPVHDHGRIREENCAGADRFGESERSRLIAANERITKGTDRLKDAHSVTLDMENTANSILGDLASQRETLLHAKGSLRYASEGLEGSRRLLAQMARRAAMNKMTLWVVIGLVRAPTRSLSARQPRQPRNLDLRSPALASSAPHALLTTYAWLDDSVVCVHSSSGCSSSCGPAGRVAARRHLPPRPPRASPSEARRSRNMQSAGRRHGWRVRVECSESDERAPTARHRLHTFVANRPVAGSSDVRAPVRWPAQPQPQAHTALRTQRLTTQRVQQIVRNKRCRRGMPQTITSRLTSSPRQAKVQQYRYTPRIRAPRHCLPVHRLIGMMILRVDIWIK